MSTELKPEVLNVDVVAPKLPLTLVDSEFLATLRDVEKQVAEIKIVDQASAQLAASLQTRLTAAGTNLERARVALKEPFLSIERKIDATAKKQAERIELAKKTLKSGLIKYDQKLQDAARKVEEERQAEIARLEKIKKDEEDAAAKKAAEIAAQAAKVAATQAAHDPLEVFEFDESVPTPPAPKTETEKQIETLKFAPAPVIARPSGVRYKTKLVFEVSDPHQLPSAFQIVSADEQRIRATYCVGWKEGDAVPELPGVKFSIQKDVDSTGRMRSF